jgi:hypothetical protein
LNWLIRWKAESVSSVAQFGPALLGNEEKVLDVLGVELSRGAADEPIHELVENLPRDVNSKASVDRVGCLRLPICRDEEISDLTPVCGGKGMITSVAYVVDDFKIPKDLME